MCLGMFWNIFLFLCIKKKHNMIKSNSAYKQILNYNEIDLITIL